MTMPKIMGIVNVTPDSFSDGGHYLHIADAIAHGRQLSADGATWVDVGGESTRPGADPVTVDEEIRRVVPVVEALAADGIAVSIDTMKSQVARAALAAGARMVNDVTALADPEMLAAAADANAELCLMHMQGTPRTMQANPTYGDVVAEVREHLLDRASRARAAGVDRILIDPGIGFGKTVAHNLALLRAISTFAETGYPVLIGLSRKTFLGKIVGSDADPRPVGERSSATLAAELDAARRGAAVIRTHDVRALSDGLKVQAALLG